MMWWQREFMDREQGSDKLQSSEDSCIFYCLHVLQERGLKTLQKTAVQHTL